MKIQNYKNLRQLPTPAEQDQKLKDVSKLYEKQFLREMMKSMRSTVSEGGFMPANNAEKIFREQLDQEYVEKWGDRGGIGLADMIHEQLLDKLGPALGIRPGPIKPMGPIKLDEKSKQNNPFQAQSSPNTAQITNRIAMKYDLQKAALQDPEVTAPWKGTVLGVQNLGDDQNLVEMSHDNGLKSQMVFRGQIEKNLQGSQLQVGSEIQAGQRLGLLSPEAKSFFWNVDVADPL
jgi:flagellar protein FlgJ